MTRKLKTYWLFCFALLFAVFALLAYFVLAHTGDKIPRGNYIAVEYDDGRVVFHQSASPQLTTLPEYLSLSVRSESKIDSVWKIRCVINENCDVERIRNEAQKIAYGILPSCFEEVKNSYDVATQQELQLNVEYTIIAAMSVENREHVGFMLVKCPEDGEKTCLQTNSPYKKSRSR